jgi:hypothetical protein
MLIQTGNSLDWRELKMLSEGVLKVWLFQVFVLYVKQTIQKNMLILLVNAWGLKAVPNAY